MIENCKKISILGLIIIAIIACQKDDAIPEYNNFSDALATSGDKRIQRGDFASFADLSKGVIDRTWTIPVIIINLIKTKITEVVNIVNNTLHIF